MQDYSAKQIERMLGLRNGDEKKRIPPAIVEKVEKVEKMLNNRTLAKETLAVICALTLDEMPEEQEQEEEPEVAPEELKINTLRKTVRETGLYESKEIQKASKDELLKMLQDAEELQATE